jgi:hypothetical protein
MLFTHSRHRPEHDMYIITLFGQTVYTFAVALLCSYSSHYFEPNRRRHILERSSCGAVSGAVNLATVDL